MHVIPLSPDSGAVRRPSSGSPHVLPVGAAPRVVPVRPVSAPAPRVLPIEPAPPATDAEICPSCGSALDDGVCPQGHTILRCPTCSRILLDGICPSGCPVRPLYLGYPGRTPPPASAFALEVVDAPVPHRHDVCPLPETVVVGRDFRMAKTPYLEPVFADSAQRLQCSRTYLTLSSAECPDGVRVTLVAENPCQTATVDGVVLSCRGDASVLREGGILSFHPGFRVRLVRIPS